MVPEGDLILASVYDFLFNVALIQEGIVHNEISCDLDM